MLHETYNSYDRRLPGKLGRYWTCITYDVDGSTYDGQARSAKDAINTTCETSMTVRGEVDAMDGATVLATFRAGEEK